MQANLQNLTTATVYEPKGIVQLASRPEGTIN